MLVEKEKGKVSLQRNKENDDMLRIWDSFLLVVHQSVLTSTEEKKLFWLNFTTQEHY